MKFCFLILICLLSLHQSVYGQKPIKLKQTGVFNPIFSPLKALPEEYAPVVVKHKTSITEYTPPKQQSYKLDSVKEKVPLKIINKKSLPPRKKTKFVFTGKKMKNVQPVLFTGFIYKDIANKNIKYTDKNHGFVSNSIPDIIQDNKGNIWVGTSEDGLCKLSGTTILTYTKESGLPSNSITKVVCDQYNNIWVGTKNGVCFIRNDSIFLCSAVENHNLSVEDIFIDSKKNVWISSIEKGAYCYKNNEIEIFDRSTGLTENWINHVAEDNEQNMWFGTNEMGFIKFDQECFYQYYGEKESRFNTSFFFRDVNEFWICQFQNGFLKQKGDEFYRYHYVESKQGTIYDVVRHNNTLWIADYFYGLFNYDKARLTRILKSDGFSNAAPFNLLLDNNTNLWIGTLFHGIFRFDENKFMANDFQTNIPMGITEGIEYDKLGNLWFLPNGGSLVKSTGNNFQSYDDKEYNMRHVWDAVFRNDNSMWAATYSRGILHVTENVMTYYQDYGINIISDLELVGDSVIYASSQDRGVIKFDFKNFYYINEKQGLKCNQADNLLYTSDDELWISVKNSGISILKENTLANIDLETGLCSNTVNCIYEDSFHNKWIGTDEGLNIIQGNNIYSITKKDGIIAENIKSILQVNEKTYWVATDKGLTKLCFEKADSFTVENFSSDYGLYLSDFNSTAKKLENGEICWSTNAGLVFLNQDSYPRNPGKPLLSKDFILFNDSIRVFDDNQVLELPSGENLKVAFYAIDWGYEDKLKYRYSLTKEEELVKWNEIGNSQDIVLTEMLPGKYYLKIQAIGANGLSDIVLIEVYFQPKWYQTIWFRAIIFFMVLFLIFTFIYIRISSLRKNEKKLQKRVEEKTQEIAADKIILKEKNEEIEKQNKLKDALIQEIHHRVKNNMQSVSMLIDMQINSKHNENEIQVLSDIKVRMSSMALMHKMLYNSDDLSNISIKEFLNKLVLGIGETLVRSSSNNSFRLDIEDITIGITEGISLGMLTSEFVSNSIKHGFSKAESPEILITLNWDRQKEEITYILRDNGIGFPEEFGESENTLGIRLIKIFAKQLDGCLEFSNENGAVLKLFFPYKKS